jgi:myosin-5
MGVLGFSSTERDQLFTIVALVLNIGNISFEAKGGGCSISAAGEKWLSRVLTLSQCDRELLVTALSKRSIVVPGQATTYALLDPQQASFARDALGKFIYGRMFDWLVQRVNRSMGSSDTTGLSFIGILDIFGFEIFQHNSFEQLCINFTNERLQQHFNNNTFKLEEKLYMREGIQFQHIEFIDNQPMLDLITKRPVGVLPLLDEELVVPKGSDLTFLAKLKAEQKDNRVFRELMREPTHFVIVHYAGEVQYNVQDFLEKNRDTLSNDLESALFSSQMPLLRTLFPADQKMSSKDKRSSLSKQFQSQLADLMTELSSTEPHYIRCIKPNSEKRPRTFTTRNCLDQLTYSGVFEAVAIRKKGFPFRLSHGEFVERYDCILREVP